MWQYEFPVGITLQTQTTRTLRLTRRYVTESSIAEPKISGPNLGRSLVPISKKPREDRSPLVSEPFVHRHQTIGHLRSREGQIGNLSTRSFWGDGDVCKRANLDKTAPSFTPKSKLKQGGIFATATLSKPASKAWCLFVKQEMPLLAYNGKKISLSCGRAAVPTTLIFRTVRMQGLISKTLTKPNI